MFQQTCKSLITKGAILALLFAQLAVAGFTCPAIDGAAGLIAAVAADDEMHSAMPGCEMGSSGPGEHGGNANLCLQHCQSGEQSVQTLPHIAVPAFAAVPLLIVDEPAVVRTGDVLELVIAWTIPVPLPPPLARFGVLRI